MSVLFYRTPGTEDRELCDHHPNNVLVCWCGYISLRTYAVMKPENQVGLIAIEEDEHEQDALFSSERLHHEGEG